MTQKKFIYDNLIKAFDQYDEIFKRNVDDKFLINFFNNFEDKLNESKFSTEQLEQIKARLDNMLKMFNAKKEELKGVSVDILEKQDQLNRYITNSNVRK